MPHPGTPIVNLATWQAWKEMKRIQCFHNRGIVVDQREHEAADVQINVVDMALQVQGAYKLPAASVSVNQTNNIVDLSGADRSWKRRMQSRNT